MSRASRKQLDACLKPCRSFNTKQQEGGQAGSRIGCQQGSELAPAMSSAVTNLQREGKPRVAVGCVQEDRPGADEAPQVGVLLQRGAEAHVAAVHVAGAAVRQSEQELHGAWAVVGVDEGHLHACTRLTAHLSLNVGQPSNTEMAGWLPHGL